jgi:excinuclease ABC subunit A
MNSIVIKGAKSHNLKNVSISIPRHKLIVITGLSGSGKSSLAFDTIYAEGQRRYVESLSAYARQFLELMAKPDVDSIEGLSPAIAIDQKTTSRNPRSTVGTVTEIYDYLRLLFARIGVPTSPATGLPISSQTVSQMVDSILAFPEGQKILLLAPIVRGRKGSYRKELTDLRQQGFQRVQINGEIHQLDTIPSLEKQKKHNIEVVVDRLSTSPHIEERLVDSIETALKLSDGLLFVQNFDSKEQQIFSEHFACPITGFTLEEIEPRLFSFNSPFGACSQCDGLGTVMGFDEDLVVADKNLSIKNGALAPLKNIMTQKDTRILDFLCKKYKGDISSPFRKLPEKLQRIILYGTDDPISFSFQDDLGREKLYSQPFPGLIPLLEERFAKNKDNDYLQNFTRPQICKMCKGQRLNEKALCVKINEKNISNITSLSVFECLDWIKRAPKFLSQQQREIAQRILREISERLSFLERIGLGYLSLSRMSRTLSGGENQRIRLASQIGSGLTGVLYVLDEPSIGLHQRDNAKLISTLLQLRDLGNTVIVVEHDQDTISHADFIVDLGPRAGNHGGEIVAKGSLAQIKKSKKSLTGLYLSGKKSLKVPPTRRIAPQKSTKSHIQKLPQNIPHITISQAHGNNLKHVDALIPLRVMTAITGVSGSGKSTLINQTLLPALDNLINANHNFVLPHEAISGIDTINKIIKIDQSPIGRTPRSNPATYTGLFTLIREWFAAMPEAKTRGYSSSRFSFNVKGGRCEKCRGDGLIKIEMHFLPEVYVSCDECHGKRYNRETLQILYKNLYSISDVLNMTVDEAAKLFHAMPEINRKLETLRSVGLGYIKLGQQATTLSGGEAQRIKLSRELGKRPTGDTIYLLDEPTTGLHFNDIDMLLQVLHKLVNEGNTIIIVEHNLDIIKNADWILDLGPESGHNGGHIIAAGTPEHVANIKKSFTGQFLAPLLTKN